MVEQSSFRTIEQDEAQPELEKTRRFVEQNTVPARKGRRCVDGRYDSTVDSNTGMISRPGGDFGYVMALMRVNTELNLGLSTQECFEAIYEVVTRDDDNFYMHTDHHADPLTSDDHENTDHPLIGCGHASKATNEDLAPLFGVNAQDMRDLITFVKQASSEDEKIVIVNLPGDHDEKGVLSISSENLSVRSQNGDTMYFLYDEKRDNDFMKDLVEKLDIDGLSFDGFKNAADSQLNAILELLAKGLPVYSVTGDSQNPHVTFTSTV